jgi:hypothetical protein
MAATLNPETEWIPSAEEQAEEDDPFRDNPYAI